MAYNEDYNTNPVAGFLGQIVDLGSAVIISRTVETAAGIGHGLPVQQGAADKGCVSVITDVLGVTVRSQAHDSLAGEADTYHLNESAALLREGVTYVMANAVVSAGDPVWVDLTASLFTNVDPGSGEGLHLPGSRWETSGGAGTLQQVRFDLSVPGIAGAT